MNTTITPEGTRIPIETLDLCCGGRRCPVVTLFNDGTLKCVDGDQLIQFDPEQVVRLRALLIATLPKGTG